MIRRNRRVTRRVLQNGERPNLLARLGEFIGIASARGVLARTWQGFPAWVKSLPHLPWLRHRDRRLLRAGAVATLLVLVLGYVAFFLAAGFRDISLWSSLFRNPVAENSLRPLSQRTIPLDLTYVVQGRFQPKETLYGLLTKNGVSSQEVHRLMEAAAPVYDLRLVKAGHRYRLVKGEDQGIIRFEYQIDGEDRLVVKRQGSGYTALRQDIPYERRLTRIQGTVHTSLYEAVLDAGMIARFAVALADIFAWEVDFVSDIREGDGFRVLYEAWWLRGKPTGRGRILAADFVTQGEKHRAVYFQSPEGRGTYYTPTGESLRRMFLKSPLQYRYISSRYSRRRFHPILRRYRPHLGVDYAAPLGTPVVAVGNGRVRFAGRKGQNGKLVVLRHNSAYTTTYAHLSRIARGIRRGRWVSQGQVIGTVGSTGLSTGPHLDFRVKKNGRFVNSLKLNLPRAQPVPNAYREAFVAVAAQRLAQLEGQTFAQRGLPRVLNR